MVSRIKTTTENAVISEMDILESSVNQILSKDPLHFTIPSNDSGVVTVRVKRVKICVFFFLMLYTYCLT
jgi:hypothetical protein